MVRFVEFLAIGDCQGVITTLIKLSAMSKTLPEDMITYLEIYKVIKLLDGVNQ